MSDLPERSRSATLGAAALLVAGVLGVLLGAAPFAGNAWWILAGPEARLQASDLVAHGPEAMGLSREWALLSSAAGTYLGGLLLAASVGWLRGRSWAPTVTWTYVFGGLAVNVTDMLIFAFHAAPGRMRTGMLAGDGVALLFPIVVAAVLLRRRAPSRHQPSTAA